jgi:Ca-activated chloride channel homolog
MRRAKVVLAALAALAVAVAGNATPVAAQGWIEPVPGVRDPGVVKVRTNVIVRVTDRIAAVEVEEWFRNGGGVPFGEGDYLYPLPGEAVFQNFSLFQGDVELRGETLPAERARAIYEDIVRRKKDPALIELVGHGLVRARVFPIAPGETRKITMRYTQVLARAGDALHFRYAAGGRFAGVAPAGGERAQGPQRTAEPAPLGFRLIVEEGGRFRDPFSPTHEVRVARDDGRLEVRPQESLTGDFALFLPLAGDAVGLTVAAHRPAAGEDGYFMLTLSPEQVTEARVARDVTVVVDVSGSMSGEKMEQARGALRQLLGTLDAQDRVRLIAFSTTVRTWRETWTAATPAALREARDWVERLRPDGGTNISGALAEAFRAESSDARLPIVVFLTDGLPSTGETNPERIAAEAEQEHGRMRVFAFGVGYDVNTLLLDRLSAATRGSTQYVQPGEDVEQAVGALAAKVRHPVLADLELADASVRLAEVYPSRLPDLFAGEELIVFGRYEGAAQNARVAVAGRRSSRAERYATTADFPRHTEDNDYIPRLWASRKLGELTRTIRLEGPTPELVEEIRETALRYGLLSEYTSYLVLEPEMALAADGTMLRPAAPPALQRGVALDAVVVTGRAAVGAAEQSRREREVRSLADVKAAQETAADAVANQAGAGAGGPAAGVRTVAGRTFALRDGVWTDAAHATTLRVVEVRAFSAAYFALLRALPELEAYWKELPSVLVAGKQVSIRVGDEGVERLPASDVARVVRDFRGR